MLPAAAQDNTTHLLITRNSDSSSSSSRSGPGLTRFRLPVCGDGVCEEAELCSTCPADCGECPLSPATKLAIGLPLSLLCLCFTLAATVRPHDGRRPVEKLRGSRCLCCV